MHRTEQATNPLWTVLGGVFITTYDFFAVNIALPALRQQFDASSGQLQWIVAAYGLCFGSGLLAGSRLAEVWGAERAFRIGVLAFAAATLGCTLAPTATLLIMCRALQGLAAAALSPQVLTLLARLPDSAERQRGFAGYGVALGLGPAVGQVVAGAAVELNPWGIGWRLVFLLNAVLAVVVTLRWRTPGSASAHGKLDWWGVTWLCLAMALLVLPLIEGRHLGWPLWLVVPALAGLVVLASLWRRLSALGRTDRLPLIDRSVLKPRFRWALLTLFLFYTINASFYLILSLTLQSHFGLRPLAAAGVFLWMVGAFLAPTYLMRRIQARWGHHALRAGALVLAIGHLGLAAVLFGQGALGVLLGPLAITGLGIGLIMAPLVSASVAAGGGGSSVSGLTGSAQWLGNALGAAAIGSIFLALAGDGLARAAHAEATVHLVCAAVALAVWGLAGVWLARSNLKGIANE
jgi:predicted MFS family arabinose efflux permease